MLDEIDKNGVTETAYTRITGSLVKEAKKAQNQRRPFDPEDIRSTLVHPFQRKNVKLAAFAGDTLDVYQEASNIVECIQDAFCYWTETHFLLLKGEVKSEIRDFLLMNKAKVRKAPRLRIHTALGEFMQKTRNGETVTRDAAVI